MTGESSPNHSSEEQQNLTYDDPNTPQEQEYDPNYVPEREFVLMPLFRRIGEMLGIRRKNEDWAPEPAVSQTSMAEPEHLSTSAARVPDEQDLSPSPVMQLGVEAPPIPDSDVLGIEEEFVHEPSSEQPEPVMAAEVPEPKAEPVLTAHDVPAEPKPAIVYHEQIEPEPAVAYVGEEALPEPIASEQHAVVPPVDLVAIRQTRPQPTPARPVLTQEDIAQLIAPITEAAREAAAKISAAMSQAAEWLHTKEEEIVRRAELALESKRAGVSQPSAADAPKWESDSAPALQREAAWIESGGIPVARAKEARPAERRPLVIKPKRPVLWKRIDWAQEFTPKRVAVLGGVAMAMLMVVGVSLARRPASSVLPHETTHVLQSGGVTLTTHPRTTAALPSPTSAAKQATPASQRQSVAPTRGARRAAYDDGPDVVTHYYNKQKPSPVHQSTVAGVKHYSDMETR